MRAPPSLLQNEFKDRFFFALLAKVPVCHEELYGNIEKYNNAVLWSSMRKRHLIRPCVDVGAASELVRQQLLEVSFSAQNSNNQIQ